MALKGKVLQEFFVSSKQLLNTKNEPANYALINEQSSTGSKTHSHFRIFDNPPLEQLNGKNIGQSSDKVRSQPRTNIGQSSDKHKTNLGQNEGLKEKTQDKVRSQPRTQLRTNLGQNSGKIENKVKFSSLIGLQREIVLFIYEQGHFSRDRITAPLSIEHLAISCKTTKLSAQKTVQRLEKKEAIIRAEFKNGRGGWTRYGLPDLIYQEILHTGKFMENLGQTQDKVRSQPRTQPRTDSSSSSSYIINNKNTTTTSDSRENGKLAEEWHNVDIEPLSEVGFSKTHFLQIAHQGKLSAEMVQTSIHAFAFDLKRNNKVKVLKTNPVNYFMGILRNGQPYAPPSNYESPQDEALRIYVEKQRELEKRRAEFESNALDFAFKEWLHSLNEAEKNQIVPHSLRNFKAEQPKIAILKEHFTKEIWPKKCMEIMQVTD